VRYGARLGTRASRTGGDEGEVSRSEAPANFLFRQIEYGIAAERWLHALTKR